MSNGKINTFGIDVSKLEVMSKEEFLRNLKLYQDGEQIYFDKIVFANLKLVLSIVNKYDVNRDILDDVFQIGVYGLIKAIKNFDASKNVLFSTYAVPLINGEIKRFIRENYPLKVSRKYKDILYKVYLFKDEYYKNNGFDPSIEVIADSLNYKLIDVKESLECARTILSIDESILTDKGENLCLGDQIKDPSFDECRIINLITLKDALKSLKPTLKKVINQRYFLKYSQEEIAKNLNVSQAQVSRLEKTAISYLKKYF